MLARESRTRESEQEEGSWRVMTHVLPWLDTVNSVNTINTINTVDTFDASCLRMVPLRGEGRLDAEN